MKYRLCFGTAPRKKLKQQVCGNVCSRQVKIMAQLPLLPRRNVTKTKFSYQLMKYSFRGRGYTLSSFFVEKIDNECYNFITIVEKIDRKGNVCEVS